MHQGACEYATVRYCRTVERSQFQLAFNLNQRLYEPTSQLHVILSSKMLTANNLHDVVNRKHC
jgi:hypothetical protein